MTDPMWRQIAEDLRLKIESGEYGDDDGLLPSELELRDIYQASRNTIRDSVKWLTTRGLVVTRPGQGTYVVKEVDPFVTPLDTEISPTLGGESTAYASESSAYRTVVSSRERTPRTSDPRVETHYAKGMVADELRLPPGAQVVSRHQERFIDDVPWSLQTTFYPMSFVVDGQATLLLLASDMPDGAVPYLEAQLGKKQAGWRDKIKVRMPDPTETAFFRLPDDGRIAILETIRTGYFEDGTPFRVTVTTYPADRNQFVITVGTVPDEEPARSGPPDA